MKIKRIVFIASSIAIGIVIFSIILYKAVNTFYVPKMENIQTAKIVPGMAGAGSRDELLFDLSKEKYRNSVSDILKWLKTGRAKGNAKDEFMSLGSSPTVLIIELKDGRTIEITSSVGYIGGKFPNGTFAMAHNIEGQVTIYDSHRKKSFREYVPKLKSFIDGGWTMLFDYNY